MYSYFAIVPKGGKFRAQNAIVMSSVIMSYQVTVFSNITEKIFLNYGAPIVNNYLGG